jgi:outer membrane protein assembly factor BamB
VKTSFGLRLGRCLVGTLLAGGLLACGGPEKAKPLDLGPNTPLIGVRTAWTATLGGVNFPLDVRVVGNTAYVASSNGLVVAIDARTGGDIWRAETGQKLSAGLGSDGRYIALVTRENELLVLDAGREIWRKKLSALTLTAPLVAGGRVFTMSGDRTVSAFDAADGRKLWQQQRNADSLMLGQSGVLMPVRDTLLAGVGGRLLAIAPQSGKPMWEVALANSRGTNEVERLVDLVSGVSREGDEVCVRAFQSSVGCFDTARGALLWSKPAAGATGLDGDKTTLFGTESDGRVWAMKRSDGERLWTLDRLRFRTLSAPLLLGRSLVVGDETGVLHFLSRSDGSALNRVPTDGSPITVAPVLVGQTLVVVTQRGGVFGFKPD